MRNLAQVICDPDKENRTSCCLPGVKSKNVIMRDKDILKNVGKFSLILDTGIKDTTERRRLQELQDNFKTGGKN